MPVNQIAQVMYFVHDRRRAVEWYALLFETEVQHLGQPDFFLLRIGEVEIVFHQADDKGPVGVAGQVVYWQVDDFAAALERAQRLGAQLFRGPLRRLDGQAMCQLRDPFGNALGLVGK